MELGIVQIGGFDMKKKGFYPIIRHRTSNFSRLIRYGVLVALWFFVFLIIYANVGFHLRWYSDNLVSLYLLFNLQTHADTQLFWLMGILFLVVCGYALYRWHQITHTTGGD